MPTTRYLCQMPVKRDISLKSFNTFGIDVKALSFLEITSASILEEAIDFKNRKSLSILIIGGGSNILFTKDFEGLVLLNRIMGKEIIEESKDFVFLKVSGGEDWPGLVDYCVSQNWGGIENLSLIPGTVGAAPIQNIGAYGVEAKEAIVAVETVDIRNGEAKVFSNSECKFGYRSSIFKTSETGNYFITSVTFRLKKRPRVNLNYAPLKKAFESREFELVTINEVSEVIKQIRRSKLPDPHEIGNAGSFFKNPVIDGENLNTLIVKYPGIPNYPFSKNRFKLAAGWLIEQCGWKGKRLVEAGVHEKQALVLVNYKNASGKDILDLAFKVRKSVEAQFGISLEFEVNVI